MRNTGQCLSFGFVPLLGALAWGCHVNPAMLPPMLIGAAIDNAALSECEPELIGKAPEMADAMFGRRLDTFSDVNSGARLLVFRVSGEENLGSRYVVEVAGNVITALYKTRQDIEGLADTIRCDVLKAKTLGKTQKVIERETDLTEPKLMLHSRREGGLICVYDVRKWPDLQGARYCVLRFDARDLCRDVRMVGVSASIKTDE